MRTGERRAWAAWAEGLVIGLTVGGLVASWSWYAAWHDGAASAARRVAERGYVPRARFDDRGRVVGWRLVEPAAIGGDTELEDR